MPEQRQQFTHEEIGFFLQHISQMGKGLTHWEKDFVRGMILLWKAKVEFTNDQVSKIDQIYSNKTPLS